MIVLNPEKEESFLLGKSRPPERIPLLILEADPFSKYFVKEGMPSHMPLVSLKGHTLANLLCFLSSLKILLGSRSTLA